MGLLLDFRLYVGLLIFVIVLAIVMYKRRWTFPTPKMIQPMLRKESVGIGRIVGGGFYTTWLLDKRGRMIATYTCIAGEERVLHFPFLSLIIRMIEEPDNTFRVVDIHWKNLDVSDDDDCWRNIRGIVSLFEKEATYMYSC